MTVGSWLSNSGLRVIVYGFWCCCGGVFFSWFFFFGSFLISYSLLKLSASMLKQFLSAHKVSWTVEQSLSGLTSAQIFMLNKFG